MRFPGEFGQADLCLWGELGADLGAEGEAQGQVQQSPAMPLGRNFRSHGAESWRTLTRGSSY